MNSDDRLDHPAGREAGGESSCVMTRFGEVLSRYGPDSEEASAFVDRHGERTDLRNLLETAARLKRAAGERAARRARRTRALGVALLAAVALLAVTALSVVAARLEAVQRDLFYDAPAGQTSGLFDPPSAALGSRFRALEGWARAWPPGSYVWNRLWTEQMLLHWARSGLAAAQKDDFRDEEKVDELKKRVALVKGRSPGDPRVYVLEGEMYISLRQFARAAEANRRAVAEADARGAVGWDRAPAYNNLAWSLYMGGELDEARRFVDELYRYYDSNGKPMKVEYQQTARAVYESLLRRSAAAGDRRGAAGIAKKAVEIYEGLADHFEAQAERLSERSERVKGDDEDYAEQLNADAEARRSQASKKRKRAGEIRNQFGDATDKGASS